MPMKRTRSDESAANPNQTIKQYSFRLSAQLYEEASALYRRLGIPISTALSAFFAGTVSAGTLPFSLSQDYARFLETCAHDARSNVRFPSTRPKRRDWKRFLSGFPMRSVRGITCGKSGKRWFLSSLNRRGRIRRKQFFGGWGYLCRMASRSFCSSPSMCGGCRFNPGKILPNT